MSQQKPALHSLHEIESGDTSLRELSVYGDRSTTTSTVTGRRQKKVATAIQGLPSTSSAKVCHYLPSKVAWTRISRADRKSFMVKRFPSYTTTAPEISLLVSTYQKPWHLMRVLQSIAMQRTHEPFEVIVTDDGSTDETHRIVESFAKSVSFPVILTTHRHVGFQLARCRNEGVVVSTAPYLLFLDGDCVLPQDHVSVHLEKRRVNRVMCGYCARLDEVTSKRFDAETIWSMAYADWVSRAQIKSLAKRYRKACFYRWIRHPNKPRITGGNCAVWRSDFVKVNGYDENFEGWGGEDTDLGIRLRQAGMQIDSILKWTHTYHLWHASDVTAPDSIRNGMNQSYLHRGFRFTQCIHGLVNRKTEQINFAVVGMANQPDKVSLFLEKHGFSFLANNINTKIRRPEVELLFLPGRGDFSGRAGCNVLVVLEDCPRAKRLVKKSHLLISDTHYDNGPQDYTFRLADFRLALNGFGS